MFITSISGDRKWRWIFPAQVWNNSVCSDKLQLSVTQVGYRTEPEAQTGFHLL